MYLTIVTQQVSFQLHFTSIVIMRVLLAFALFVAVASAIPQTKVHINCSSDPSCKGHSQITLTRRGR